MILEEKKQEIIAATIEWQKLNFPNRTKHYDKCERDLNYVLEAYIADIKEGSDYNTSYIGIRFWQGDELQIKQPEVEVAVHNFLVEYITSHYMVDAELSNKLIILKDKFIHILNTGLPPGIEKTHSKRRQIRQAWRSDKVPSESLIHNLLQRTMNVAPSKQNLFPFKIHAFGPDNEVERDIVAQICCLWEKGAVNNWNRDRDTGDRNPYKKAPWVMVFESRLCEPNTYVREYSEWVEEDHYWTRFTQCDKDRFRSMCNTKLTSIEVGMFIQTFTGLCLENDIHVSYIRSFPDWLWKDNEGVYKKDVNNQGLNWDSLQCITEQPLMVIQAGYKADIEDPIASNVVGNSGNFLEDKPDINDIVSYHYAKWL